MENLESVDWNEYQQSEKQRSRRIVSMYLRLHLPTSFNGQIGTNRHLWFRYKFRRFNAQGLFWKFFFFVTWTFCKFFFSNESVMRHRLIPTTIQLRLYNPWLPFPSKIGLSITFGQKAFALKKIANVYPRHFPSLRNLPRYPSFDLSRLIQFTITINRN